MTDESAYTLDLRVIWQAEHTAYEIPCAGTGSWWIVNHGSHWDTIDPDGQAVGDMSGSPHADDAIHTILGDPQDATDNEIHLLTHAAAMGGWLSADYVTGAPHTQWPGGEQVDSARAEVLVPAAEALTVSGLWEIEVTGDGAVPVIYRLTAAGVAKAAELAEAAG
jgi:hypothetical protein